MRFLRTAIRARGQVCARGEVRSVGEFTTAKKALQTVTSREMRGESFCLHIQNQKFITFDDD
jgi:hypothetical protein